MNLTPLAEQFHLEDIVVCNMTLVGCTAETPDLRAIAMANPAQCLYTPSDFSGMTVITGIGDIRHCLFSSRRVVILGAKTMEDVCHSLLAVSTMYTVTEASVKSVVIKAKMPFSVDIERCLADATGCAPGIGHSLRFATNVNGKHIMQWVCPNREIIIVGAQDAIELTESLSQTMEFLHERRTNAPEVGDLAELLADLGL